MVYSDWTEPTFWPIIFNFFETSLPILQDVLHQISDLQLFYTKFQIDKYFSILTSQRLGSFGQTRAPVLNLDKRFASYRILIEHFSDTKVNVPMAGHVPIAGQTVC